MKSTVAFIAAAVGGVFCDVISKWLVFSKLDDYKSVTLIPGFLNILRSKNEGVVFGLLPGKTNAFIIPSILTTGIISAAVPVKKHSSAAYKSHFVINSSFTWIPICVANFITTFLVMPISMPALGGGVKSVSFLKIKILAPAHSAT